MLKIVLPGHPPTANNLFATVRGGRRVKTREYRFWLDGARMAIQLSVKGRAVGKPYGVRLLLYDLSRRRDLDNCVKPVLDALVLSRIVPDDRWLDSLEVQRASSEPHPKDPRTVIYVREL